MAAPVVPEALAARHESGRTLFISDLHLAPERPMQAELFRRFISEIASAGTALYILGDFFEAWVGDDDISLPFHAALAGEIKRLVDAGVPVFFMPGNRDFLAGPALAERTGWVQLADPSRIELHGTATLISHGDAFCTDDHAYQAFRQQVRSPDWQAGFLAKPLAQRRDMARAIREQSEQAKAGKKPDIMDVNPGAIDMAMRQAGVTRLIHGHTHRPARHVIDIDGTPCERWVLTDWYETGGYLACDAGGCQAFDFA